MLLGKYYDGIEIHREERIVYVKFLVPHRVISTCRAAGGIRDGIEYLYNHQSCEPAGHHTVHRNIVAKSPEAYRQTVCEKHGLPPEKCATLGTAANMRYAAITHESFRDLEVVAVCTGGVEANAGRIGDPASMYEHEGKHEKLVAVEPVKHGTINTMIFINRELTPGAMVRVVMTATEAKTAVLQELAVNSRYSDRLATGTGTDQIGIAVRLDIGVPLTGAGKHSKLGELIGITVHDAIEETLALQNGLTPKGQRSVLVHIERFGTDRDAMCAGVCSFLSETDAEVFRNNFQCINKDPLVVAAVAALVHLKDKICWEILPESCIPEILGTYGAQVASAVSGEYDRIQAYRLELGRFGCNVENKCFLESVYRAIAFGFSDKWRESGKSAEMGNK